MEGDCSIIPWSLSGVSACSRGSTRGFSEADVDEINSDFGSRGGGGGGGAAAFEEDDDEDGVWEDYDPVEELIYRDEATRAAAAAAVSGDGVSEGLQPPAAMSTNVVPLPATASIDDVNAAAAVGVRQLHGVMNDERRPAAAITNGRQRGGAHMGINREMQYERRQNQHIQRKGSATGMNLSERLSKKTLSIVTNLTQMQSRSSRREQLEMQEEKRLAAHERRQRQLLVQKGETTGDGNAVVYAHTIRILVLGDTGVGKTSLIHRYTEDSFSPNLISTAGVDFRTQKLQIDGKWVKLMIWDTAGQEKFHVITRAYYRGAHGIAFCYDVTDTDSFKNVNYWIANIVADARKANEAKEAEGETLMAPVQKIIIGNKTDITGPDERKVSVEEGEQMAAIFDMTHMAVSAKDGTNVKEAFYSITYECVKQLEEAAEAKRRRRQSRKKEKNERAGGAVGGLKLNGVVPGYSRSPDGTSNGTSVGTKALKASSSTNNSSIAPNGEVNGGGGGGGGIVAANVNGIDNLMNSGGLPVLSAGINEHASKEKDKCVIC